MISVVIPMYNSEDTIIRALNSIKNQTAINLIKEIIVVNDGSKDNSLKVVNEYKDNNKELNIKIIDKKNGGVSTARNEGIKNAISQYIALLDSDDEWIEDKIEKQMEVFATDNNIYLVGTNLNGKVFKRFYFKKFDYITKINTRDLMFKNFFQPSTVMFKKDLITLIGYFPEDQKYAEEGNFFLRATYNSKCVLINKSYLNFGFNKAGFGESGLSGNLVEMQKGEIRNLKFAKNQNLTPLRIYYIAFIYSYAKYLRRILITKIRNK